MSDLISRKEAIDALMSWVEEHKDNAFGGCLFHWTGIKALLENLPSAQPKKRAGHDAYGRLKVGKLYFEVTGVEYENISVGEIIVPHITKVSITCVDNKGSWITEDIERKSEKGKWICTGEPDESWGMMYECSICGNHDYGGNYCSYCGAKMEDSEDETD